MFNNFYIFCYFMPLSTSNIISKRTKHMENNISFIFLYTILQRYFKFYVPLSRQMICIYIYKDRILVIATSMGFTLAASTFTRMSVGFLITGILTLESFKSFSPLYECICQACILSSLFSFNMVDRKRCFNRTVHFNRRIVLCIISSQISSEMSNMFTLNDT